jgi:hypothetical protein
MFYTVLKLDIYVKKIIIYVRRELKNIFLFTSQTGHNSLVFLHTKSFFWMLIKKLGLKQNYLVTCGHNWVLLTLNLLFTVSSYTSIVKIF